MRSRLLIPLILFFLSSAALAQEAQIPERLLLATGQYIGTGSRALGLGGTYTGIADDYSSIWWNPAGLSQVKRIEVQGSLSRMGFGNETDYYGGTRNGSTSALRLNNAGMVFPVPVYQGALSFAVGYSQLVSFDRRTRVTAPSPGTQFWDDFDELESGRLGLWSLAGAVDVSPNLALGLGFNYWTGSDDYTLTGHYTDTDSFGIDHTYYHESAVNTDLSAWGINVGGLFRLGRFARFGLMFQSPMSMSLNEDWEQGSDNGFFDYRMTYPAVFRTGFSYAPGRWLLAADLEYRDWTSMDFRSEPPYNDVSRAEANQQIKDTYQGTTRFSLGGEYLFPAYGVRARAGYSFEPSAYQSAGGNEDRSIFSFGVGVLVDRSVMLDAAFRTTSFTEKVTPGLTEDIRSTTALVTLSYRM